MIPSLLQRATALAIGLALFSSAPLSAQLAFGGEAPTRRLALAAEVPTEVMDSVPVEALLAEDATRTKGQPFRFGETLPVQLGLDSGVWTVLPGGDRIWRMRIESRGAYSISLMFSRYQLPVGAELYVYNDARSTELGAFTWQNNKENGQFAIRPVAGQAITLEYYEPKDVEAAGELVVGGVVHDYRNFFDIVPLDGDDYLRAAPCEVDVNCPEGDPWRPQIDATLRVQSGGALCSGSLLNNTAHDGTQYFMSANHCGAMENAIFLFNYQRDECGVGNAPQTQTVQGAVEMATSPTFDFRLMRITEAIPQSYNPYFAGWDRRKALTPPSTVAIHHPAADEKKVSLDFDSPLRSGDIWTILSWDVGITEGGSSGSPLYSNRGRFLGQLCCGTSTCVGPELDTYQRMDAQWSMIKDVLDPLGTLETKIDGYDPYGVSITNVSPSTVEALSPGTAQDVTISGDFFTAQTTLLLDGVEIDPTRYTFVNANTMTVNLPAADVGDRALEAEDEGRLSEFTITVVETATPQLQAGNGEPLNPVSTLTGVDTIVAGVEGTLHYVLYSTSGVVSIDPTVSLCLGNDFAEVFLVGSYTIPAEGWLLDHHDISGPISNVDIYVQSVVFDGSGLPLPVSNCQSFNITN